MKRFMLFCICILTLPLIGCVSGGGNTGRLQSYPYPEHESQWIRNGEPIEFEGEFWYPFDGTEILLDSEMYQVGQFKDISIYVEKTDVKPYDRIYTKFDRDEFRFFLRRP